MLNDIRREFVTSGRGSHTLETALVDWFVCGLYAGLRLGEWAQEASQSHITSYQLNKRNEARALCMRDVRFEGADRRQYSAVAAANATNTTMVKCWIKFRTQKNGQNGEEKLFARISSGHSFPINSGHCFPSAMLRIVRRFTALRGYSDLHTPLAIYAYDSSRYCPRHAPSRRTRLPTPS
jgi:hypothetical protein